MNPQVCLIGVRTLVLLRMDSKLKKIFHDFVHLDHSRRIINLFHRWLVNGEHVTEKNEMLHELWSETESDSLSRRELDASFHKVMQRVQQTEASVERPRRHLWWQYAAAVAIIVLTTVGITRMTLSDGEDVILKEFYAQNGKLEQVVLPDGSTVFLNGGSYIYYPENLKGKTRSVHLVGEAVFKVAKNPEKPFVVHSMNMSVTALGTEFNVRAYPENDYLATTLLEGKVQVNCNDSVSYILSPGEQVIYNKLTSGSELLTADVESVTAWQRGEMVFNRISLNEILQTLEHRFGIECRVIGKNPDTDKYNFVFRSNADIDEVLKVMSVVVKGFSYQLKNGICYVHIDK